MPALFNTRFFRCLVVTRCCSLQAAACLLVTLPAWSQAPLPTAPASSVADTFHGVRVDDPYREFENTAAPAVAGWMKAHGEHARGVLRSISGREALRSKLERYAAAAAAQVLGVTRLPGDTVVYQRRGVGDDGFKLVMRQGLQGREAAVFDPDALKKKTGQALRLRYAVPSPDGRLVAVGISPVGTDAAVLRVLETRSGRQLGRDVDRAPHGGVSWLPDSSGFFFHRLQAAARGATGAERELRSQVVFMKPGAGEAGIRAVVTAGQDLGLGPAERVVVEVQPDGRALLVAGEGGSRVLKLWHSTAAAVLSGKAGWQVLAGAEDRVTSLVVKGERFYALTHAGAPRGQVVGGALDTHTVATAAVLVPESERVLTGLAVASDALYVAAREGNLFQLLRRAHQDGAAVADVPLPVLGSFSLDAGSAGHARADLPGLLLRLESWTRAAQIFALAPDGRWFNTGLQPSGPDDAPGDVLAAEVWVQRPKGAPVPLSIIHKADAVLDGNNPVLLLSDSGHGGTERPVFSASRMAWLDAGGVFAVAHPRNPRYSSAYESHNPDKPHEPQEPDSGRDLIACAEWLVDNRWTQPSRLAIAGAGAGGMRVGMAMSERPNLFAAVVAEAGLLDMLRAQATAQGATLMPAFPAIPAFPAFGSRASEDGFLALWAMSPYHHIQDGVKYPAVLFTHGVNDPRVPVWHTTKTAARLLAASTSGKPVLVRLSNESGSGAGAFTSPLPDESADLFAFLLWQLGVPGYAPALAPARR